MYIVVYVVFACKRMIHFAGKSCKVDNFSLDGKLFEDHLTDNSEQEGWEAMILKIKKKNTETP